MNRSINWKDSNVLITGGTGSFGKRFVDTLQRENPPRRLIIFSRDELKQHEMRVAGFDQPNLRYFIGDIRDENRLHRAFHGVDVVIHAAALKQVPACEYNPIEAVLTNVMGARNIIDAALDAKVNKVLALSTDKAAAPINLYGATKLVMEKLLIQANAYGGIDGTRFSCVRYGNVIGSRGSVVPVFKEQKRTGKITITDPEMTRFWITIEQGVRFVISCVERMFGGEVFIPKLPSMNIMDLAGVLAPNCEHEIIGIRSGEKLHECMISADESRQALDLEDRYVLTPSHAWWQDKNYSDYPGFPEGQAYASDTNPWILTRDELQAMINV